MFYRKNGRFRRFYKFRFESNSLRIVIHMKTNRPFFLCTRRINTNSGQSKARQLQCFSPCIQCNTAKWCTSSNWDPRSSNRASASPPNSFRRDTRPDINPNRNTPVPDISSTRWFHHKRIWNCYSCSQYKRTHPPGPSNSNRFRSSPRRDYNCGRFYPGWLLNRGDRNTSNCIHHCPRNPRS